MLLLISAVVCGQGWNGAGLVFQRAWTIPMRRAEPSCCWASPGPLSDAIISKSFCGCGAVYVNEAFRFLNIKLGGVMG